MAQILVNTSTKSTIFIKVLYGLFLLIQGIAYYEVHQHTTKYLRLESLCLRKMIWILIVA